MGIQAIRGFRDILPDAVPRWQIVERVAREVFEGFGYGEILLPYMEYSELFAKSIGETTDIVEKEMYTLEDSKGRGMSLRPEGTASVVRAYIQNSMHAKDSLVRLYYTGPMFRHERPQKGRFRQFYQLGVEALGSPNPWIDIEMLSCLSLFLDSLGLADLDLEINSIGDSVCRPKYREALVSWLSARKKDLCEKCRRRLRANPMRVLDCKEKSCGRVVAEAPVMLDHLCDACRQHFDAVLYGLDSAGLAYRINPRIVRGLDYYTRTAFEVITGKLGAQNAVAGGGRYDDLVKLFGGPDTPAVGFAVGVDRVVALLEDRGISPSARPSIYIAVLGESLLGRAIALQRDLVESSVPALLGDPNKGLKNQLKRAHKMEAAACVIIGEDEVARGLVKVRDMSSGEQIELAEEKIANILKGMLSSREEK